MARRPVLGIARKLPALSGGLTIVVTSAALLAGVASATSVSLLALTPGASIPSSAPCGTIAESMAAHGFRFPAQETGNTVSAFKLPGSQAPSLIAEFKLSGTFLNTIAIPASSCGSGGTVAE
jgi:hypothetical protein